jgi:hypothetical protein
MTGFLLPARSCTSSPPPIGDSSNCAQLPSKLTAGLIKQRINLATPQAKAHREKTHHFPDDAPVEVSAFLSIEYQWHIDQ